MLTTQILVENNEKTIKNTLDSLVKLKSKVIIGDMGSSDNTIKICKEFELEIVDVSKQKNYSKIRNQLIKEGLNFYINPWETLEQGEDFLNQINETTNVYVFQNDVISKEIRIWKNEQFKNPVYETIINKNAAISDKIIISSKKINNDIEEKLKLVKDWMKDRPLDLEPYYYLASCYLSLRDYKKFLFYANEYCNRENKINNSLIMMKYYMAQVKLHTHQIKEAAELTLTCISYLPSYAEFWCLLGDIFYHQKKWEKSKCFYENAMTIGKKRKNKDEMPIEIKKYKQYPESMIKNIDIIKNNISIMG